MLGIKISGTLIWYYFICKREVWFIAHEITPFQDDPFLEIGRILHSESYYRERKEIEMERIKFDILKKENNNLVVAEIKKSSKFLKAAEMQVCFYLYNLKKKKIEATGEILIPKEKKKIKVILDKEKVNELKNAFSKIIEIVKMEKPPAVNKTKFCRVCAYRELCFA